MTPAGLLTFQNKTIKPHVREPSFGIFLGIFQFEVQVTRILQVNFTTVQKLSNFIFQFRLVTYKRVITPSKSRWKISQIMLKAKRY